MANLKKRITLIIVVVFLLALATALTILIVNKYYFSWPLISGILEQQLSINGRVLDISYLILTFTWIIALIIIVICLRKYRKIVKSEKVKKTYFKIKENHTQSNTDLDTLYNLLQQHEKLKMFEITKVFNIDEEKAIEWSKILENNELAELHYPAFSEPILETKKKEEKEDE